MEKKTADFYQRLQIELDKSNTWPAEYLFKFIVPSVNDNADRVQNAFNGMGAVIKFNTSKTGKFISVSVNVIAKNSQEIINKYQELAVIEGIVSL